MLIYIYICVLCNIIKKIKWKKKIKKKNVLNKLQKKSICKAIMNYILYIFINKYVIINKYEIKFFIFIFMK